MIKVKKLTLAILVAISVPVIASENLPVSAVGDVKEIADPSLASITENIPSVPVSVMKTAARDSKRETIEVSLDGASIKNKTSTFKGSTVSESSVINMQAGVNQIIPVAIGHPNRIVTPFGSPEILSTSLSGGQSEGECGEICVKDNVVYVATDKDYPVTMFITEKGNENRALSLTMLPKRIPPREVFLKMEDQFAGGSGFFANKKAERWEKSQPYVETVRTAFRKLALGEVPQGYTLSPMPNTIAPPVCEQEGVSVNFTQGQLAMGHSLSIFVGVAENVSGKPIEFKEATCGDWDVAAVTTWPLKVLEPRQKTEVYVARKIVKQIDVSNKRPSLLNGGF